MAPARHEVEHVSLRPGGGEEGESQEVSLWKGGCRNILETYMKYLSQRIFSGLQVEDFIVMSAAKKYCWKKRKSEVKVRGGYEVMGLDFLVIN